MINKVILIFISLVLINMILVNCSDNNNPIKSEEESLFDNYLSIETNKLEYNLYFNGNYYSCSVSGILINTTKDTFYTKLGDPFNTSFDQDDLSIAFQTDGFFEYKVKNANWENVEQYHLIEGSKVIRLLPGKEYIFGASAIIDTSKLGYHRIRVNYYKDYLSATIDTLKDTSNVFTIIK